MANHPHDKDRPESAAVMKAVEAGDMEALGLALSPRMRAFCTEYVVDFNGSAAYIRAGYAVKWADRGASQLLRNAGVRAYIDHLTRSKEAKITAITPDYVIGKVTAIISSAEKDSDKLRGLELLARHLGMFIERTEITGKDGGPIEQKQVAEDVSDFTNMINGLRKRAEAEPKDIN